MAVAEKELYLKIGRPQNDCVQCGAPLASAGKHPSVLKHETLDLDGTKPQDGPQREDYCPKCWQAMTEKNFMGFWLARRDPPKPRKIQNRRERNAAIAAWFENLREGEQTDAARETIFFLAHLLMKYGVLKWARTETAEDGTELIIFRYRSGDEETAVTAVDVPDTRGAEIKKQLDEFLAQYDAAPAPDIGGAAPQSDTPESAPGADEPLR